MVILHVVSVPIGNPDDITIRALRVLREAHVVAAEDTRVTRALLRHHGVEARLVSYHDHNEQRRAPELVERMRAGEHVALVSDAGTPLVNDPGWRLVRACIDAGIPIDVVPGPCAAVAALTGAGLPVDRFLFAGFVPRDGKIEAADCTTLWYESPRRLPATLDALAAAWPTRRVCVARNLTKEHEQWLRGTAAEVRAALGEETRGEVVLLVEGVQPAPAADADIDAAIARLRDLPTKEAAGRIAEMFGLAKKEAYERVLRSRL